MFNAVNTALAPVVVPLLFVAYTGVDLDVPVVALTLELAITVLVPTVVGMAVRTAAPQRVEPIEQVLSAGASLSYLALLLAVVGPNASTVRGAPGTVVAVAGLALALSITGYLLATATRRFTPARADHTANSACSPSARRSSASPRSSCSPPGCRPRSRCQRWSTPSCR